VSIALVTNAEHGQAVQALHPNYDPAVDDDLLVERLPGSTTCTGSVSTAGTASTRTDATSSYVSQSSYPVWFSARVSLFHAHPPDSRAMADLPSAPRLVRLSGH
jgi:hypothetical protein